jgi:hypothetical protein
LLAVAGLGGGLALLGLSFRLGVQLMLDPAAAPPLLSRWVRSPQLARSAPVTLKELRQEATAAQQRLGEPLPLGREGALEVAILPVLAADSEAIERLVLVQGKGPPEDWQAIASLAVEPLAREIVLAPWLSSPQPPTAAPAEFALTRLAFLPAAPAATEGTWLSLEGTWQQQGLNLRYGQLVHLDPQPPRLTQLEPWSSPRHRPPQWVDLDGDGPSDLVIDETVGLDPALRGFQVLGGEVPRLQAVSWVRVPVDAGARASDYQQVLRLARGGLWQAARPRLEALKVALGDRWSPAAEAQRRLIERHAALTKQQAEQDWSTPTQQILALLMDGRWEAALTRLEADPSLTPALVNRLGVDPGRLWNRISAAAALPDPEPAVYVWGGLALKAQESQPTRRDGATPEWLDRQPVPAAARQRLTALLAALADAQRPAVASKALVDNLVSAKATQSSTAAIALPPIAAFIGQGRAIPAPPAGSITSGQALERAGQWYAVVPAAIHQGGGWRRGAPPATSPAALWAAMQPAAQAPTQLLRWVSPSDGIPAGLTVQGLTPDGGTTTLLATGPAASDGPLPPLAFTEGALRWLDASQQTAIAPGAIAAVTAAIVGSQSAPAELADTLATLPLHRLDLTGDGQPDQVLTVDAAALAQLRGWGVQVVGDQPKSLIFDGGDRLLYSDLFTPQNLVALTNPAMDGAVGLLVYRAGQYDLALWNGASQQFE